MKLEDKINYRIFFKGANKSQLEERFYHEKIKDNLSSNSLEMNEFEKDIINRVVNLVNLMFVREELKGVNVSKEEVILLNKDVYRKEMINNFKYIYLTRDESKYLFVKKLVYSIANAISFHFIEVSEDKKGELLINIRQLGYQKKENNTLIFEALNQAAIEFLSDIIMSYVSQLNIISEDNKKMLSPFKDEFNEKFFFDELFFMSDNSYLLWKYFLRSYIYGDNNFLNLLSENFPLIFKDIKHLKVDDNKKIYKIAKKYGDSSFLEKINKVFNEDNN